MSKTDINIENYKDFTGLKKKLFLIFQSIVNRLANVEQVIADGDISISIPVGVINPYVGTSAPTSWALCDGSAISRTTYSSLFATIGTTYGAGDGSTTFNLPDLRGEFIRGLDNGRGVDSGRTLGSSQSDATASNGLSMSSTGGASGGFEFTDDNSTSMRVRVRTSSGVFSSQNITTSTINSNGVPGSTSQPARVNMNIPNHSHTLSGDAETRPRNVALNYIIKIN